MIFDTTDTRRKGVVLTHCNLLSNCAQLAARMDFNSSDMVLNALPVVRGFGPTGGAGHGQDRLCGDGQARPIGQSHAANKAQLVPPSLPFVLLLNW